MKQEADWDRTKQLYEKVIEMQSQLYMLNTKLDFISERLCYLEYKERQHESERTSKTPNIHG